MSEYLVLQQDASGYWRELGAFNGRSAREVIRGAVSALETIEAPATFLAVPTRSAKRMSVEVQNVRRVKVG